MEERNQAWFIAQVAISAPGWRKSYINGEWAETVKLSSVPGALKPGSCRIGDWFPDKAPSSIPRRGFRGRIDELAVWRRAVSHEKIREMVAAGRSTLVTAD